MPLSVWSRPPTVQLQVSTVMPSVLVEVGYLSNPADEKALASDAHIVRLATAMARAVDGYFGAGPFSSERAGRRMR